MQTWEVSIGATDNSNSCLTHQEGKSMLTSSAHIVKSEHRLAWSLLKHDTKIPEALHIFLANKR
ncbi:hypothetical protein I79_020392 [Cricetulus griseus]|uniref:Uncharacterized protein n=1 Tax=Cricetulus griseus TaxID=10029 RepID=G3I9Y1_CRIGR|nr:hypothetical protein I79_020392 [Cricetulus griseus]